MGERIRFMVGMIPDERFERMLANAQRFARALRADQRKQKKRKKKRRPRRD